MIKFFNTTRQKLLSDGKTGKYLKYAVGEIILVVVGILIALQVNNWNEERKSGKLFQVSLDHLYTSIKVDVEILYYYQNSIKDQVSMIDKLLENPDSIESQLLINSLYWVETDPNPYSTETSFHLSNLRCDPSNDVQNYIAKRISTIVNNEWWNEYFSNNNQKRENYIRPKLKNLDIAIIHPGFGFSPIDFEHHYLHKFSKKDIEKVRSFLFSGKLQNALRDLKLSKVSLGRDLEVLIGSRTSVLNDIKGKYPDTKLLFENIGIIGNVLETGWDKSVPMTLTDENETIWEIKIRLKKGKIKFRANESWLQNWGENPYNLQSLQMNGNDIEVEEGFYHIRINLSNNDFHINRLE